jgi:hypothetical protein
MSDRVHVLPLVFDLNEESECLEEALGLDNASLGKIMESLDGESHSIILNLLQAFKEKRLSSAQVIFLLTLGAEAFFDINLNGWRLTHTNVNGGPDAFQDEDFDDRER